MYNFKRYSGNDTIKYTEFKDKSVLYHLNCKIIVKINRIKIKITNILASYNFKIFKKNYMDDSTILHN